MEGRRLAFAAVAVLLTATGCVAPLPKPGEIVAPTPIQGNSGEYMCPYTSDRVLADWVDKAINARAGATLGRMGGAYLGQKACEQIPFVGGMFGSMVGEKIGRSIAIEASGGWDYIRDTSDLSFGTVDSLAIYLYAECSSHEHYAEALKATWAIYPELQQRYYYAIRGAPRKLQLHNGGTQA